MKRLLFYLPERVIGGCAPPASQLTSYELLNYLKNYYDIVVYSKGCNVEGVEWISEEGKMPHSLHDAIEKARPDITWSYMNWGYSAHKKIPTVPYFESVTYMPFKPHPELKHLMAEATYVLSSVPHATYVHPFVPHSETVVDIKNEKNRRNVLYMHHPNKGLSETICFCKEARVDNLFITLEQSEVQNVYNGVLPDFVKCVGRVTGQVKRDLLNECDALAYFTKTIEAIGMSPCEAMLSGLPVLGLDNLTSVGQYIRDGNIPSLFFESSFDLSNSIHSQWPDKRDVQDAARTFFNHHRAIGERIDFIERLIHNEQIGTTKSFKDCSNITTNNHINLGGSLYDPVIQAAKRLKQPFVWIGREHPVYGAYLTDMCRQVSAKRILEFGTQCGGSAIPLAQYCQESGAELHIVDTGYERGADTLSICLEAMRDMDISDNVIHHRGYAKEVKLSGLFDLIHIDHLKSDYERTLYQVLPYLSIGGKVVFHDTDNHAKEYTKQIEKNFHLEWNHDIDGGCAVYTHKRPESFQYSVFPLVDVAAQLLTYKEGPFLESVLRFLVDKVKVILVMEDKNPMSGSDTSSPWCTKDVVDKFISENPESQNIIQYIQGDFGKDGGPRQEAVRRTESNRIAREEYGCKYSWIVDADELYDDEQAAALWKWFHSQDIKAARCGWYTYWRSIHWRVNPPEPFNPLVIVDTELEATLCRDFNVDSVGLVPEDVCMVRHYSWVRKPKEVQTKIRNWGHAHQVIPNWFDKFMSWVPGSDDQNWHPTNPDCYKSIVRCEMPVPKAMDGHPYTGVECIEDEVRIKVVVLHHNMPESADSLFSQLSMAFDDVELMDCGSDPDKIPMNLTIPLQNVYWEGAWLEAMSRWADYDVIWVVGCDIKLQSQPAEYRKAIEESMPFGCWSPAIDGRAHPFMLDSSCRGNRHRVKNVEGMALAISGDLVKEVGGKFAVSTEIGFGQDYWLCAMARQSEMPNYIDGTVVVEHPPSIGYNETRAHDKMNEAFEEKYGVEFRQTLFEYRTNFIGNLFKEKEMSKKKLTIASVDNGWGVKEFNRITERFKDKCNLVIMRKGISDFSGETEAEVVEYDPELKRVLEADIVVFTRIGAANRDDFEKVLAAGVPIVANNKYNNNSIVHEKTGFLYEHESWGIGWIKTLVANPSMRELSKQNTAGKVDVPTAKEPESPQEMIQQEVPQSDISVSIITPTFRRDPRVVSRCLDCVRLQSVSDIEQLVCSDGAAESQIASLVASMGDIRISYQHTTVKKPGDFGNVVRHEMLQKARGKYILFLDDDNLILPNYLERMIAALEESGKDFAVCRVVHFGPLREEFTGKPPQVLTGFPVKLHNVDPLQILVKREVMLDIGWDTEKGYLADGHTLQALGDKYEGVEVPEVLGYHM